jgi:hypothetical protein
MAIASDFHLVMTQRTRPQPEGIVAQIKPEEGSRDEAGRHTATVYRSGHVDHMGKYIRHSCIREAFVTFVLLKRCL